MSMSIIGLIVGAIGISLVALRLIFWILSLRRVVPTNEVHIVQKGKHTISYGVLPTTKDGETVESAGNTYYEWPSWLPIIGITKTVMPISNFTVELKGYEAYDRGRLPFITDVMAIFRIAQSNVAASRVASFGELVEQLDNIVKGSVRAILANSDLEEIMSERSKYGEEFTKQVEEQLKEWGVVAVKNIELMDIRDTSTSQVIHNIMEKKKSHIDMESRVAVAKNSQAAQEAEIAAQQEIDLKKESARQTVGQRQAEVEKQIGIASELAKQEVQAQAKITAERDMAVKQVQIVQEASILKEAAVIKAEENKQTAVINAEAQASVDVKKAEGEKQKTVLTAEGMLFEQTKVAEGIKINGEAEASAKAAIGLAEVQPQITLAKEIGQNKEYQTYLITIEQIKAGQVVGVEQAKALTAAEIKVIANGGDASSGINNVMQLLTTPQGGTSFGSALDGFANTDVGKTIISKIFPASKSSTTE